MEGWTWPWAWGFLSIPQEWPRKHSDKSSIDFIFFQPLSILISLENGQIHLHIKSWRTFRTFPGKCRENDCSSIFCLKNGVTWVTPFSIGKFPWGSCFNSFPSIGPLGLGVPIPSPPLGPSLYAPSAWLSVSFGNPKHKSGLSALPSYPWDSLLLYQYNSSHKMSEISTNRINWQGM